MRLRLKKIFVITVLLGYINLPVVSAQETAIPLGGSQKPVMYSIFGTHFGVQHGEQPWGFPTI